MESFYKFWGKLGTVGNYHLLPYHCLDVAACISTFLDTDSASGRVFSTLFAGRGDTKGLSRLLPYLFSFHDLGKFACTFQELAPEFVRAAGRPSYRREYNAKSARHDSLGWWCFAEPNFRKVFESLELLPTLHPDCVDVFDARDLIDPLIRATMGHHGTPPLQNPNLRPELAFQFPDECRDALLEFLSAVKAFLLPEDCSLYSGFMLDEAEKLSLSLSWSVAGIGTLCDWLASNEKFFSWRSERIDLEEYYYSLALPQAKEALLATRVIGKTPKTKVNFASLFPHIKQPSGLQRCLDALELSKGPQLHIIEEATGAGKTEASLLLASRLVENGEAQGIFFALPSMASANSIYSRILHFRDQLFGKDSSSVLVALAHSRRNINSDHLEELSHQLASTPPAVQVSGATEGASWLSQGSKRALLATLGAGTVDQALLGVLPIRHQSLRLLGISRNVLIIDEVHSYDPYMSRLIGELIAYHASLGGSAILLSATLASRTKKELIEYFYKGIGQEPPLQPISTSFPLITSCSQKSDVTHTPVVSAKKRLVKTVYLESLDSVLDFIYSTVLSGKCVCWIRNTVHDAIEGAELLKSSF